MPGCALYSATKVFESYLAEALNCELKQKVDVISFKPSQVVTNMSIAMKKAPDAQCISAQRAAEVCFRDLGSSPATNGALRHELYKYITIEFMPRGLMYWIYTKFMLPGMLKQFHRKLNAQVLRRMRQNSEIAKTRPKIEDNPENWKHIEGGFELATFGAGCYWGTQKYFQSDFAQAHPGVILGTSVGFMSPDPNGVKNPTYREVCGGSTGHVEVVHILFDSQKIDYQELVKFFFQFHDSTTLNRQGNDQGTQYASVIFTHSPAQHSMAKEVVSLMQALLESGLIKK